MTPAISAPVVSAPVLATVCRFGRAILAHEKTGQDLLAQVGQWAGTAHATEQNVLFWAIAQNLWQENFPKPRSLWQEISRGKREGGKPSARWTLVGPATETTSRVDIMLKEDTFHLPLPLVAALGRIAANAANKASQMKARLAAQESETRLRKATLEDTRKRQEAELAETIYKQGQEHLYDTLASELQEMRSWQGNAPEVFPAFASPSMKRLAERNWQYQIATDATKNREMRTKYALWRNKKEERLEEHLAKERERIQQANAKNAILAQNFGSILTSIENETAKLPVSLKEARASEMREVLQTIRYLLEKTH